MQLKFNKQPSDYFEQKPCDAVDVLLQKRPFWAFYRETSASWQETTSYAHERIVGIELIPSKGETSTLCFRGECRVVPLV